MSTALILLFLYIGVYYALGNEPPFGGLKPGEVDDDPEDKAHWPFSHEKIRKD